MVKSAIVDSNGVIQRIGYGLPTQVPNEASVGDLFINGILTKQDEPIESIKARMIDDAKRVYGDKTKALISSMSVAEIEVFKIKYQEAFAYQNDTKALTPLIDIIADGDVKKKLRIIDNIIKIVTESGKAEAEMNDMIELINNAKSIDDLNKI